MQVIGQCPVVLTQEYHAPESDPRIFLIRTKHNSSANAAEQEDLGHETAETSPDTTRFRELNQSFMHHPIHGHTQTSDV